MISQPVSSIFSSSPLPFRTRRTPGLSIPWCCLPTSSPVLPCLLPRFPVPCKMVLVRPNERETWPYHCSLRLFTMVLGVFVWSDCLLDLGTDFLVGNMVFAWDAWYLAVLPHLHGLYSSLELCCEDPWFTSVQQNGCDTGAHQSYLGSEKWYNGKLFNRYF